MSSLHEDGNQEEVRPRPSLQELQEENQRLRTMLAAATQPVVTQTSPGGAIDLNQITEIEGTMFAASVEQQGAEVHAPSAASKKASKKKKGSPKRPKSREKSREEKNRVEQEKKKQNHVNKVLEAHWQGRMDGRLGNEKPVPVSEKQSLRLRQPHEQEGREVNPAMQPLPITAKEQEVRTALITGVRPYLPAAQQMEQELGRERAATPPVRSRSPSPTAFERAVLDTKGNNKRKPSSRSGSRPGSKERGRSAGAGAGAGAGARVGGHGRKQQSQRSASPAGGPGKLPVIVVSASTSQLPPLSGMPGGTMLEEGSSASLGAMNTVTAGLLDDTSLHVTQQQQRPASHMMSASAASASASTSVPTVKPPGTATASGKDSKAAAPQYAPPAVAGGNELFPVSSQLLRGLKGTVGHRPMVLTLLASKRALWKVSGAQQFDPHLHLAAYPPPPDKIVVNLYDVGTVNPGGGDKYNPQQASFVVNVREYTGLLYDLVERYRQREEKERQDGIENLSSVGDELAPVPPYASTVPQVFAPSSLEWWSHHLPSVVVVRAKGDGSLMVRISKASIEKLVQAAVHDVLDLPPTGWRAPASLVDSGATIAQWWENKYGLLEDPMAAAASADSNSKVNGGLGLAGRPVSPPMHHSPQDDAALAASDEPYKVGMFAASHVPSPTGDNIIDYHPDTTRDMEQSMSLSPPRTRGGDAVDFDNSDNASTSGDILGVSTSSSTTAKGGKKHQQAGKKNATKKATGARSVSPSRSPSPQQKSSHMPQHPLKVPDTYKPKAGRSKAPGFFGNEAQAAGGALFDAWNDNVDVDRNAIASALIPSVSVDDAPPLFNIGDKKKAKPGSPSGDDDRKGGEGGGGGDDAAMDLPLSPNKKYGIKTAEECARDTIIKAREVVSTKSAFRNRKLSAVEAGLFRSPFAKPLVTAKMKMEIEKLEP